MRGLRYASVVVVGLLVAPVTLHAQNTQGNQNPMCSMLAGMFKTMNMGGKKMVVTPAAPAGKTSGTADSAAKASSGAPADSSKAAPASAPASASAKPASNNITCNFTTAPAAADSASKKTADSASHGSVADTTKAAEAKKP